MCIPYAYLLTHIPSGKKYYGIRFSKKALPSDLLVDYFTSSKYVKELMVKDGVESFSKEIRRIFNTVDECRNWETKVLRRMKVVKREDFLNKTDNISISHEAAERGRNNMTEKKIASNNILGRNMGISNIGRKATESTREKISDSLLGNTRKLGKKESDETRNRKSIAHTGKPSGMLGKHHSEETKAILSIKSKNNPNCLRTGMIHTDDSKLLMSISRKGKSKILKEVQCIHCNIIGKGPNMTRYHFNNCKKKVGTQNC